MHIISFKAIDAQLPTAGMEPIYHLCGPRVRLFFSTFNNESYTNNTTLSYPIWHLIPNLKNIKC